MRFVFSFIAAFAVAGSLNSAQAFEKFIPMGAGYPAKSAPCPPLIVMQKLSLPNQIFMRLISIINSSKTKSATVTCSASCSIPKLRARIFPLIIDRRKGPHGCFRLRAFGSTLPV